MVTQHDCRCTGPSPTPACGTQPTHFLSVTPPLLLLGCLCPAPVLQTQGQRGWEQPCRGAHRWPPDPRGGADADATGTFPKHRRPREQKQVEKYKNTLLLSSTKHFFLFPLFTSPLCPLESASASAARSLVRKNTESLPSKGHLFFFFFSSYF